MPSKTNPLKLNALQLKTLTLLQALAEDVETAQPLPDGGARILSLPHPHGDHFHIGRYVALSADASGLENHSVWLALSRKGLALGDGVVEAVLTPMGLAYDTGLRSKILHGSDH